MTSRIDIIIAAMSHWARHDIDDLLELVADDIEWHYHVGSAPIIGKPAMRAMLNDFQHRHKHSSWRLIDHAESDRSVFIEAIEDYENADGHRVQFPYTGVYQFTDDNNIAHWRDYFDMKLMASLEAGAELPPHVRALVDRAPTADIA